MPNAWGLRVFCGREEAQAAREALQLLGEATLSQRHAREASLLGGNVVVALHSKQRAVGPHAAEARVVPSVAEFMSRPADVAWWHVGMMYLSPWRPTFHLLTTSDAEPLLPDTVSLRATGDFANHMIQFDTLARDMDWFMCFFAIVETPAMCAEFVPGELCVRPTTPPPELLWPPTRKLGGGGPRGRGRQAWSRAATCPRRACGRW